MTASISPREGAAPIRSVTRPSHQQRGGTRERLPILLLSVIAMVGVAAVLINTRSGPGIEPDSAVYLGVAHNLVHGRGLTVPFTTYTDRYTPDQALAHYGRFSLQHFPPLYPFALAVGGGGRSWTRLLNALLFGVNLMLVGLLTLRMAGRLWIAAVCGAAVMLVSPGGLFGLPWLLLHSAAISEPLFLTCALASVLALAIWLESGTSRWFWTAATLAAAATLTRYVGFSVTLAGALAVVLWARGPLWARLRSSALFAVTGIVPTAVFLVVQRTRGTPTRALAYHPPRHVVWSLRNLVTGWFGLADWPHAFTIIVPGLWLLALVALGVYVLPRRRAEPGIMVVRVLVVLVPLYVIGVVAAHTWFDASVPIDQRLMSPVRGLLYLLVFGVSAWLLARRARDRSAVRVSSMAFVAVALVMAAPPARSLERVIRSKHPPASELAVIRRALVSIPPATFIATNAPDQVYLATGRSSIFTPPLRYPVTNQRNPRFRTQVIELGRTLQREDGVLLMSDAPTFLTYRARRDQLQDILPNLQVLGRFGSYSVLTMRP